MNIAVRCFLFATLVLSLSGQPVHAQSAEQIEQLRQQSQQQSSNKNNKEADQGESGANRVSPMNMNTRRNLSSAGDNGLPSVGQYRTQPRSGQTLPGEPTLETVFPLQEIMSNPPFAANLFIGGFESERASGLNDNYLVAPGDKISIWLWGAVNFSDVVTVDNQGNIFIPNVGPIQVADTPAGSVNATVTGRIRQVYTSDVNIYVNLLTSTPVSIFVSGPVLRPGQYAGQASDSVLYYLKRAGGIDFRRGSFRKIDIVRDNQVIATADLYTFMKEGKLADVSFKDGDVILVRPIGNTIVVETGARNSFTFEFTKEELRGDTVNYFAVPGEFISHVSVAGIRNNKQFARYLSVDAFESLTLQPGDTVEYVSDHDPQIYRINIEGAHTGASQIMVDKGTRLLDVLDHIAVEPALADIENLFLKRDSVAAKQKEIIDQALQRLERSVYTAPINSTGEGSIRVQEAELVSDFVARARLVEPEGRVVVSEKGQVANILLEPNDTIVVPEVSDLIHVGGEVMMPQSVVYNPEAGTEDYVAWAGGFTQRADDERIMVIHKNGNVAFGSIDGGNWLSSGSDVDIQPGDQVVVLPAIDTKSLQAIKDITQIIYQIAVAANVALDG